MKDYDEIYQFLFGSYPPGISMLLLLFDVASSPILAEDAPNMYPLATLISPPLAMSVSRHLAMSVFSVAVSPLLEADARTLYPLDKSVPPH